MILLHVTYTLRPGTRDEFVSKLLEHDLAGQYRREPGNITYAYYAPIEEPDALFVTDAWEDEAALEAHLTCPAADILAPLKRDYVLDTQVRHFDIPVHDE